MRASPPALPVHSDRPDLDTRLPALLGQTVGDVAAGSRPAGRTAVRRRVALLRRRRRLRRALGSSTLAAGMVAGGLHTRRDGHTSPVATAPATSVVPGGAAPPTTRPASPPVPGRPATSWSWDPGEGVDREAADPGALYADGRFHVYATSATHCVRGACRDDRVPRFGSPGPAVPGRLEGDAMPERPDWVAPDDDAIWAPAAARIGDRYVLYFAASAAGSGDARLKCLGAAISPSPAGPFAPLPHPLHCTPGYWSIDPYPVTDGQRWYLLWRQDDGANVTGRIVAARLSPDGLALAGSATATLLVGSFSWEEGYPDRTPGIGPIENPAMARHPATGEWLLTWSANRWETQRYATGLASCAGPLGPCRRTTGASPWIRTSADPSIATTAQLGGAGGLSFAVGPGNELYAVLHAYRGEGQAPGALRVAWAYRVEPSGTPAGYRLVEIARNHPAEASVSEA
jgi:Glycosyl hydrolases family 43